MKGKPRKSNGPRAGEKVCEACGAHVRIDRKVPHPEEPRCLVLRTRRDYRARGWDAVGDGNVAARIRRAGYPVERAPVAALPSVPRIADGKVRLLASEVVEQDSGSFFWERADPDTIDKAYGCQYGPYADARVVEVATTYLKGYPIAKSAVLRRLVEAPDLCEVLDDVVRVGGMEAAHAYLDSIAPTDSR